MVRFGSLEVDVHGVGKKLVVVFVMWMEHNQFWCFAERVEECGVGGRKDFCFVLYFWFFLEVGGGCFGCFAAVGT